MKALIASIAFLVMSTFSYSQSIAGIWNSGNENSLIEIRQESGQWVGKIKSSDNKKAPIGQIILKDLEKDGEKWTGKLYVLKKQRWVNVKISPYSSRLDLLVSAGWSSKEVEWQRVE